MGSRCFKGVADAGCDASSRSSPAPAAKAAAPPRVPGWLNTVLANIKTRDRRHVPSAVQQEACRRARLAEFEYRFNRRYDLPAMIPRLGWVAVRTPPMPYRLLKLAED